MVYFIVKRMIQSVFVMLAVAFLAFSLFRFVGDPITQMTGVETSVADQERLREELGLNDPFVSQFIRFTGDMLQGDFGYSYRTRQPVADMITERVPATLELGVVALIISLLVGVPAGVYTALKPRGIWTQTILMTTLVGVSIPTFVIGIMLIFLFGVQLGWLPTFGRGGTVQIGNWESSLFTYQWMACVTLTCDYSWRLSTDPHHAFGACRNDGGHAIRLHPLCHGAGCANEETALQTCIGEHNGACDYDYWAAVWRCHRVFHRH